MRLVNPPTPDADSPLDQILDLVKRSDSVAAQSEGTRVLVNVIKGLFSFTQSGLNGMTSPISPAQDIPISGAQREEAIARICTLDSTEPLAEMIGRSGRYPMLLNEGVVALTLLSSHSAGRTFLLSSSSSCMS